MTATAAVLSSCFMQEGSTLEIGVDEAGRGPMFGRVYAAAVLLPKTAFDFALMKDSKKFHSEPKIQADDAYIKKHALAWHIAFASETVIDEINIRNATHRAMHEAINGCMRQYAPNNAAYHLLIDGNDFKPLLRLSAESAVLCQVPHTCIEGGDNTYAAIAAASILAKVARDAYIYDLCLQDPSLITLYDLKKNKGYGTAKHLQGIRQHGITPQHRKSFGLWKTFA